MCGCEHHWDRNAPCTCTCPGHKAVREEMSRNAPMSATDHTLTAPERENIEELLRLHVLADDEQIVYDLFETLLTQRGVTYEARLTTAEAEKEALRAEREEWSDIATDEQIARQDAEVALTGLVAAVSELADQHWDWKAGRVLHGHLRALIDADHAAALRAEKAKALREAADDLLQVGLPSPSRREVHVWLRDRADSIEQARP